MIYLSGYKIAEQISKGSYYTVLKAVRESDNTPVVIKLLVKDYPSAKEITDFKHEYQIMSRIASDGVIKAYDFVAGDRYAIIMEEIGGVSLDKVIGMIPLSVGEKMMLAIKMAGSLAQLHEHNIIHKDINPSNFIWNQKTGELKLVDFCNSTEAGIESTRFINLNHIEGSLPYISPEQTGRISRPLDHRTEL